MGDWESRRSDDYWQGWHDGNEAAAKRVRECEVRPLKQMYSMISRTLDAAHAELTDLRNRQRSSLYSAGELSVELMPNKAVAVKPTGMIFDVSERFDEIVGGRGPHQQELLRELMEALRVPNDGSTPKQLWESCIGKAKVLANREGQTAEGFTAEQVEQIESAHLADKKRLVAQKRELERLLDRVVKLVEPFKLWERERL